MKTVRDLFVDALAMKRQGLAVREIVDALIRIAHDNGFPDVSETGRGQVIELKFPNREMIQFDGKDWHVEVRYHV